MDIDEASGPWDPLVFGWHDGNVPEGMVLCPECHEIVYEDEILTTSGVCVTCEEDEEE